jgi:hypothetical protein
MPSHLSRLRERLSYANVTATLALFVALGGTSYAAITLPRNSVGSAQIRHGAVGSSELHKGAVRSSDIRNQAVSLNDLSVRARAALSQPGPQGPPGTPAVSEHVQVNSGGVSSGTGGVSHPDATSNVYTVTFKRDVSACAYGATLAAVPGGSVPVPPAGRITVASAGGPNVVVNTFDAAGNPTPEPFHLIVAC